MPDKKIPADLAETIQKMIEAGADSDIPAVVAKYEDAHDPVMVQTLNEMKGVVEGVIPGAWGAIRGTLYDLPKGAIEDAVSLLKGGNAENTRAFVEGLKNAPDEFLNASHEDRGKMLGNFAGAALTARFIPLAPKPIARGVGTLAEQVGTKGAWPIRMMGAHQLGSGNPAGAAILAAPEVLQKGGRALQRWGSKGGVFKLAPEEVKFQQQVGTQLGTKLGKTPGAIERLSDLDEAIAQTGKEAAGRRAISARAEKQGTVAEERADLAQMKTEANAPEAPLSDEELIAQFRTKGAAKAPQTLPPSGSIRLAPSHPSPSQAERNITMQAEESALPPLVPGERRIKTGVAPAGMGERRGAPRIAPVTSHTPIRGSAYTSEEGFTPSVQRTTPKVERVPRAPLVVSPEADLVMKQRFKAGMPEAKLRGMLGAQGLSGQALEDALLKLMLGPTSY